jgi:hypothetical protein
VKRYDDKDKKQKNHSEKKELYFTPEIVIIKNFDKETIVTNTDQQVIKCGESLIKLLNKRENSN